MRRHAFDIPAFHGRRGGAAIQINTRRKLDNFRDSGIERHLMRHGSHPFIAGSRLIAVAAAVAAALAACSGGDGKQRDRGPPLVKAEPATTMRFADRTEAVGTARANEQVSVSAPVTERI